MVWWLFFFKGKKFAVLQTWSSSWWSAFNWSLWQYHYNLYPINIYLYFLFILLQEQSGIYLVIINNNLKQEHGMYIWSTRRWNLSKLYFLHGMCLWFHVYLYIYYVEIKEIERNRKICVKTRCSNFSKVINYYTVN